MTTRESYVLGWAFGRLEVALNYDYDKTGFKVSSATMRPFSGFSQIHTAAIDKGVVSDEVTRDLAAALDELSPDVPVDGSGIELVQPLANQASWDLGRYKAFAGEPLPSPSGRYDIKSKRQARGMTQAQLADAIGTDQANVSKWEKGITKPSDATVAKVMEILG